MADGLENFSLSQLNALHTQAAGDSAMRARIDAVRTSKGFDPGSRVPGMPGLIKRVEQPSESNGGRIVVRYEDDGSGQGMLSWLSPFMTDGARCRVNPALGRGAAAIRDGD
jgi:hypothetical protein